MTEAEWLNYDPPKQMLEFIQQAVGPRQTRLFACACYRRFDEKYADDRSREFIAIVERYADALATDKEVDRGYFAASDATREHQDELSDAVESLYSVCAVSEHGIYGVYAERTAKLVADLSPLGIVTERQIQAALLRCIVGNPVRPVAVDPVWRSETAVVLASGIYAERAFDRLPILADALEEAGCDHPDILAHCRGPGPHARSCWVVDGVLGKV
jgi:hypothetical protein